MTPMMLRSLAVVAFAAMVLLVVLAIADSDGAPDTLGGAAVAALIGAASLWLARRGGGDSPD